MAGVGFELKKLFREEGIFPMLRGCGYAGIVCMGPMLLGILMLVEMLVFCDMGGAARQEKELLISMITYSLLGSLLVTGFFAMTVARFLSDMLYQGQENDILPSFLGSTGIMAMLGGILYGAFLLFSGITPVQVFFCWGLFGELTAVWNAMNYLTAVRDYKGILLSFLTAVLVSFLAGAGVLFLGAPLQEGLLGAVCAGYGVMLVQDVRLLCRYFPQGEGGAFLFLRWMDEFLSLAFTGLFLNLGLYSHLVIMWAGPLGKRFQGLFCGAPAYDVPAFLAFLTVSAAAVNFVVSVEVNFYPRYRAYYSLFNNGGSVKEILQAETEMKEVLDRELRYTALKQLLITALALSVGNEILSALPLGFTDLMQGYFRTLCVGCGLCGVGNTLLLILLYFTDYKGALWVSGLFAASTAVFTGLSLGGSRNYYGFGFLAGSALFFLAALVRIKTFTEELPYHILSEQPVAAKEKRGFFSAMGDFLEAKTGGRKD